MADQSTVYDVNRGVNKSLEFKGIKAQYIIYLAAGLVALLLVFAILYVIGVNVYVVLLVVLAAGAGFFAAISNASKKYGEHGFVKHAARKQLPDFVYADSSKVFTRLNVKNEKDEKNGRPSAGLQDRR